VRRAMVQASLDRLRARYGAALAVGGKYVGDGQESWP
jgi:hypothetical protein